MIIICGETIAEVERDLETAKMAIATGAPMGVGGATIEDVEKAMKGLLAPEFKENLLGHAQVRNVFKITGAGTIAGSYVIDGKVQRNASVRLLRDNVVIFEGKLSSLRRFKDDVREVATGYECGIGLENYNDVKEGDVVECFVMEEIER